MINAISTFEAGLATGDLKMLTENSTILSPVGRWQDSLGAPEMSVLKKAVGPVLDVGCGPGRMAGWLNDQSIEVLGLDVSPQAVALTQARGAKAILGDFYTTTILEKFQTVLLVDGNAGIGGNPEKLFKKCRELLKPNGKIICEFLSPETTTSLTQVVLKSGTELSESFPWAFVSITDAELYANAASLSLEEKWSVFDRSENRVRYFATLNM